jgi:predicted DCC family thiol-disulfide oxidoreductase YuxK
VARAELVATDHPVLLFDGYCGLCNWWVDFVLRKDRDSRYRFAALQSAAGEQLLAQANLPAGFIDSFVLIESGRSYLRSAGILRVVKTLGLPYSLLYAGIVLPRGVRDWVYDFVAARRFRWFGKRDSCRLPTPEERARFL